MLHLNELPLRHLFNALDGETSGPRSFTGSIGKQLHKYETKATISFTPIEVDTISIDKADLSANQKYLLDIYHSVSLGFVSDGFA